MAYDSAVDSRRHWLGCVSIVPVHAKPVDSFLQFLAHAFSIVRGLKRVVKFKCRTNHAQ